MWAAPSTKQGFGKGEGLRKKRNLSCVQPMGRISTGEDITGWGNGPIKSKIREEDVCSGALCRLSLGKRRVSGGSWAGTAGWGGWKVASHLTEI